MKAIRLSPSALSLYRNCPRCFWLEKVAGIKRPRGIFPSLPGGMDRALKRRYDAHRELGTMPPEIAADINGKLYSDISLLNLWRNWRGTPLQYRDDGTGATLSGALDDCVVLDSGDHAPLDYKTRGSPPGENMTEIYRPQIECYGLMLKAGGLQVSNVGYLVYYWPDIEGCGDCTQEIAKADGLPVAFKSIVKAIDLDIERPKKDIAGAVEVIGMKDIPKQGSECEYCNYMMQRFERGGCTCGGR